MTDLPLLITAETQADGPAIEKLNDRAFGPGRYVRTAYRLRERAALDLSLSFVARVGTFLVGSNRLTPVRLGAAPGLLLGPLAVDPAFQSRGIGEELVGHSLAAARAAGHKLAVLVGDEPYYRRMGFKRVPMGRLGMPGPVDLSRLLYCELEAGAFEGVSGAIAAG
jgi:predicted N-acetyltransferase YhbS